MGKNSSRRWVGILLVLVPFGLFILLKEFDDGQKFCSTASEKGRLFPTSGSMPARFHYDVTSKRHINKGGKACLEEIVEYVNSARAGNDGLVNTNDDTMSLDEQLELLYNILEEEYPGGYWVHSKWHLNHNAGVSGHMKFVYADINEYLLIFGHSFIHGGYSGSFDFDIWDYTLEGEHYSMTVGNITRQLYSANYRDANLAKEKPLLYAYLPRRTQKLYSCQGKNGAIMLEYSYGNIPSSIFGSLIAPTFLTLDFESLKVSVSSYTSSIFQNSIIPLFKDLASSIWYPKKSSSHNQDGSQFEL